VRRLVRRFDRLPEPVRRLQPRGGLVCVSRCELELSPRLRRSSAERRHRVELGDLFELCHRRARSAVIAGREGDLDIAREEPRSGQAIE
jgi:hypothetical protein